MLGQGIGRFSPTMAREKSKRRVHKDQLALAVRKNFNALGVTESDVIVDWLYKSKHQGSLPRPCEPPLTATDSAGRQRVSSTLRAATEMSRSASRHAYTSLHLRRFSTIPGFGTTPTYTTHICMSIGSAFVGIWIVYLGYSSLVGSSGRLGLGKVKGLMNIHGMAHQDLRTVDRTYGK